MRDKCLGYVVGRPARESISECRPSWRRVDGVEAMIQQIRRRAATMWLRTAADMVLALLLLVSNAAARKPLAGTGLKEAAGMDQKCSAQRR